MSQIITDEEKQKIIKYTIADEGGLFKGLYSSMTEACEEFRKENQDAVDDRTLFYHVNPIAMTQEQYDKVPKDEEIAHVSDLPEGLDEGGQIHLAVDPIEPECTEDEHEWKEIEFHGHGAGIITVDQCVHCELKRRQDTYAQCGECAEQDLWEITYIS